MPTVSTTALRLAAIEALAPWAEMTSVTPQWPTLAGPLVADTGFFAVDRSRASAEALSIDVTTDEVQSNPKGEPYGYDLADLDVVLVFQLEIGIVADTVDSAGAASPAEASAKLEAVAGQIRRILAVGATGAAFRRLAKAMPRITGRYTREPDPDLPLMRLTLSVAVTVDDDDWSDVTDGLPSPASAVRSAFAEGSYAASILDAVAALYDAPADPAPLEAVSFGFAVSATSSPADLAAAEVRGAVTTT